MDKADRKDWEINDAGSVCAPVPTSEAAAAEGFSCSDGPRVQNHTGCQIGGGVRFGPSALICLTGDLQMPGSPACVGKGKQFRPGFLILCLD